MPSLALRSPWRPLSRLSRPLDVVRHFTPQWFGATMGTGVLALVLPQLPIVGPSLRGLGEALWLFNAGLFAVFSALYAARWILFPHEARLVFAHGTVSMFFGTIPMGFATIVNGCLAYGGPGLVGLAQIMWWIDAAMAVLTGVAIPYFMFTRQDHRFEQMTAIWLLPIVPAEVAAASGALLAPHLPDAGARLETLVSSYVLWAFSVPIALCMLALLVLRMALHKLPPEHLAATSWLTLGPLGTGALGLLLAGQAAPAILAEAGMAPLGPVAQGIGLIGGLALWGFAAWWMLLAMLITLRYLRTGIPFNLGWWGYTFPLGVYTLATLNLAHALGLAFFAVAGAVMGIGLALIWLVVVARTVHGAWHGHLFFSPCLADSLKA